MSCNYTNHFLCFSLLSSMHIPLSFCWVNFFLMSSGLINILYIVNILIVQDCKCLRLRCNSYYADNTLSQPMSDVLSFNVRHRSIANFFLIRDYLSICWYGLAQQLHGFFLSELDNNHRNGDGRWKIRATLLL